MNGYSYNGGYDSNGMDQGDQNGGEDMMIMGQDGMGTGMAGGQSLDDIVTQNAKAIRRQSMPHHFGGSPSNMETDMRRISMMDYSSGSPTAPLGAFQYDPNAAMAQSSIIPGNGTAVRHQHQQQRNHGRRQSHGDLALNTSFANPPQGYNAMMTANQTYQSPAHAQSGFEMTMDSPYIDPGLGMPMDYNIDQSLVNQPGSNVNQLDLYTPSQYNQPMINSPVPRSGSQGTLHSAQGPSQDPGGGNGMNAQYTVRKNSSGGSARNVSRRQSLQIPTMASPVHSGGITPLSQPPSATPQEQGHGGFQRQPQNPQPGSRQDRPIGNPSQGYDGVNGPLPVNAANYNPNNQGFKWETPEDGWPSTMVNKPHMQTSYKNAYSSTGFDMLAVLVGNFVWQQVFCILLTRFRCALRLAPIQKLTSAL